MTDLVPLLGSGGVLASLIGAAIYIARRVVPALADARLKRAEAEKVEADAELARAEAKRAEAEADATSAQVDAMRESNFAGVLEEMRQMRESLKEAQRTIDVLRAEIEELRKAMRAKGIATPPRGVPKAAKVEVG